MKRTETFVSMIVSTLCCLAFAVTAGAADQGGRATMAPEPPLEPRTLFQMPTSDVVKSVDAEVSALGVLYGDAAGPALQATLGLGDIAQMEVGSLSIISGLQRDNKLTSVPTAGLKVHLPLGNYARGVAASFHRSGSHTPEIRGINWDARVGEFHAVATIANHAPGQAESSNAGWNGVKMRAHMGAKYIDARLDREDFAGDVTEHVGTFWRPVAGFELWRDNARARLLGELNWMTEFDDIDGGSIETVRVVSGGVRFFFSKHSTFDIGVRHQDNYDGIAESAIQTKLTFHLPTHALRDRVVGN